MGERLLVIDTATAACSIALLEDEELVASDHQIIGRGHAERLVPMISDLNIQGVVDQILVDCGPGSFTGIRIGVSAARALGLAWNARVNGYQCLSLVAAQARQNAGSHPVVCVAMIGGHGEYFVQNFADNGSPIDEAASLRPEQAVSYAKSTIIAGSAAEELADHMETAEAENMLPNAASIGLLPNSMTNLPPRPIYGRKPDAEPAKERQA